MACDASKSCCFTVSNPPPCGDLRGVWAIVRTLLDEFERTLARGNKRRGRRARVPPQNLRDELAQLSHQMRDVTEGLPRSQRAVVAPVAEASGPRCIDVRRTA